jgi:hypothetical protein
MHDVEAYCAAFLFRAKKAAKKKERMEARRIARETEERRREMKAALDDE